MTLPTLRDKAAATSEQLEECVVALFNALAMPDTPDNRRLALVAAVQVGEAASAVQSVVGRKSA